MRLVIQTGTDAGQMYELAKDRVAVGRGVQNDIVLSDQTVSRAHSVIRRAADGWVIEDVGSSAGTLVNGQRVMGPRALHAGDLITVGQTTLRVEAGEAVPTLPPMPAQTYEETFAEPISQRNSSSARWALIIGSILVLLLIVGAIAFLLLNPPSAQIAAGIKSPVPTSTSALLGITPPPTHATEIARSTATVIASGADPNATKTSVPTPKPTETPARSYAMPEHLRPKPGENYATSAPVPFQWIAVGALGIQELYRVQVFEVSTGAPRLACEIRTRETFVTAPGQFATCSDRWQYNSNYRYTWRVQVVVVQANGNDLELSPVPQQSFEFSWAP